ncbi:hypothetical protein [Botrimarina hoheduenensis]|uniref:HAMP domain-containing protein n=1 Tax=Botrimarina hoheduenensis TaxID=2528000 RepID=A0A5C5WCC3_9BACT|nr:hypothetical protein [Botrimarina hoheduenensis]TWT48320.1 hypothetical protein Pla111_00830 [Botrimarina hoheduenensis]
MDPHRRNKQFIDSEVQGALARRMAIHWLMYALMAALLLIGIRWLVNPNTPLVDHLNEAWRSYGPVFIILLSMAPLFIYDAMKLSNRFTGPVLRLRRGLNELASGKAAEEIKLREEDFWQDIAEDFNRVAVRLNGSDGAKHT